MKKVVKIKWLQSIWFKNKWESKELKQSHKQLVEKIFFLQKNIEAEGYNFFGVLASQGSTLRS